MRVAFAILFLIPAVGLLWVMLIALRISFRQMRKGGKLLPRSHRRLMWTWLAMTLVCPSIGVTVGMLTHSASGQAGAAAADGGIGAAVATVLGSFLAIITGGDPGDKTPYAFETSGLFGGGKKKPAPTDSEGATNG